MSAILKIRVPFFRRKTNGGTTGMATFYITQAMPYTPIVGQTVTITHTNVTANSSLQTKLSTMSTNTVTATFVESNVDNTPTLISESDGFTNFVKLQYTDNTFSTVLGNGECTGFIEYDVNPTTYKTMKAVETPVIVSEVVPYDGIDGYNQLTNKVSGTTPDSGITKAMLVKKDETNTIFANLLKSLNLPVSDQEMMKYTRSQLGTSAVASGTTYDYIMDSQKYTWTPWTSTGSTSGVTLTVHPTTGYTGEYYGTVLQTIGSYDFVPGNKAALPTKNEVYLMFEIPNNEYGEIIDGKTIRMSLPYYVPIVSGTATNLAFGNYVTYSGTPQQLMVYGTYNRSGYRNNINLDKALSETDMSVQDLGIRPDLNAGINRSNYQSNIVLLFSDAIAAPSDTNFTSWSGGTADLFNGVKVFNQTAGIEKPTYDYFKDTCVGFAVLDKGFIVITHPLIVDSYWKNIFSGTITTSGTWSGGTKSYDYGSLSTSTTRGKVKSDSTHMITTIDNSNYVYWDSSQFVFTGFTGSASGITSNIEYRSYNTEKSLNIVCLASSNEFFKSSNDTAKELFGVTTLGSTTSPLGATFSNLLATPDYADFQTGSENLYPVMVTSLGLHDANGNLLAICKPAQPVKKYWYDVVSFNVKIRL